MAHEPRKSSYYLQKKKRFGFASVKIQMTLEGMYIVQVVKRIFTALV